MSEIKLKKVYIEITNRCNLACSFCKTTQRKLGFISPENFEKIILQIKDYTSHIYMHVLGEPLLHEKIGNLIDICETHNIKVNLTTNGTLIKENAANIIKPSLRQINFSLHSFSANEKKYSNYIEDILEFIEQAPENIYICLRFWNMDNFKEEDIKILEQINNFFNFKKEIEIRSDKANGLKLRKNVFLQKGEKFIWPQNGGEEIFMKGKCYGLKTHVAILLDGSVVPCCLDCDGDLTLGNIYRENFRDIIANEKAHIIKEGFRNRQPIEKFCKTCGYAKSLEKH